MVRFGESSIYSGASLISLIRRARRVQSSSLIRPERISASLIFASADSNRMTISDLLISREKMTLAIRCLIEHDRKKSSTSVELCVGTIPRPARYRCAGLSTSTQRTGTLATRRADSICTTGTSSPVADRCSAYPPADPATTILSAPERNCADVRMPPEVGH